MCFNRINPPDLYCSQEALLVAGGSIPYNVDTIDSSSLRSSNRSPVSVSETFWVPTGHRQSATYGDAIASTSAGFDLLTPHKLFSTYIHGT